MNKTNLKIQQYSNYTPERKIKSSRLSESYSGTSDIFYNVNLFSNANTLDNRCMYIYKILKNK